MASNITLKISADVQQAVNGIQSVNQKLDQMAKQSSVTSNATTRFFTNFTLLGSALGIASGVIQKTVDIIADLAKTYSTQEKAEIRLQSTLKATQNACGMTASEMLAYADSISKVTTFSDQEIIAVEQVLAATRKIGQDVIPEATMAILDMAAATGEDASGAAQRLAQALSDPAGEIESLKEAGIQLTEEQKKNITKVQAQNGIYEAQKILLKEVSETYGGMAKAIADTDSGKLSQISNVWTDIKEGLGEGLLNSIGPAVDWLYQRLIDIKEWIDDANSEERIKDAVNRGDGNPDFSSFSDVQLINSLSPYKRSDGGYDYGQESKDVIDAVVSELTKRGVDFPGYEGGLSESSKNIRAWALEQREQNPVYQFMVQNHDSPIPMDQLIRNNIENKFSNRDLMDFNYYQEILNSIESLRNAEGLKAPSDISPLKAGSLDKMGGWQLVDGSGESGSNSEKPSISVSDRIDEYFSSNGSLSESYQIEQINQRMLSGYDLIKSGGLSEEQIAQIKEINQALFEQKKAFDEAEEEGESWEEKVSNAVSTVSDVVSEITSFNQSLASLFSTLADNAIAELDKIEDKWDEYFDELDEKQERQNDSLNALLASGNISYGEYIDSMNAMDDERAAAEEEALTEKESAKKKADELNKSAFEANKINSLAQAAINAALSITEIWASYGANPVLAGVLTGISAAATAAEIAAISSQQYTPLAAGGIVQSPTRALIGEGGSPEMILPLTDSNMERFGVSGNNNGGVINLVINVGTAYSGDQLTEDVFRAIERAQRTGALPKWRYTA